MNPGQRVLSAARVAGLRFEEGVRDGVRRFGVLERVLAAVCLLTPAFLIFFDGGQIRDSISAYHDMVENQIFYVPLTVIVMLFVVNGAITVRAYNTILGVALAGLLLFNHDDFNTLHGIFVFIFFAGNAVVLLFLSSVLKRWWFKAAIIAGIVLLLLGRIFFDGFSTFWLEWASLIIIAFHYILESSRRTDDAADAA